MNNPDEKYWVKPRKSKPGILIYTSFLSLDIAIILNFSHSDSKTENISAFLKLTIKKGKIAKMLILFYTLF